MREWTMSRRLDCLSQRIFQAGLLKLQSTDIIVNIHSFHSCIIRVCCYNRKPLLFFHIVIYFSRLTC